MADVQVAAANAVEQWSRELRREYVRDMEFRDLMGKTPGAPIQYVEELTKAPGQDVTVSLLTRLTGDGVTGDNTLEGNEILLGNYAQKLTVDQIRQGVRVGHMEQKKTHIELLSEARPMLKDWAMNKLRDDIIDAMLVTNVDGSTTYASCTAAERNAWLTANADRVLFGALKSNGSSNVMATALGLVDSAADKLTYTIASLAKRMCKAADPHIRPVKVDGGGEWYVGLAPSVAFRDLKTSLATIQSNAGVRGEGNPLFKDGDIVWDGMIWKEVPEIDTIAGVGDSGIAVAPCFLLGAQSVAVAVGERLHAIDNERDYGNLKSVGVAEIRAVDKLVFNDVQLGMLNLFVAGVADS